VATKKGRPRTLTAESLTFHWVEGIVWWQRAWLGIKRLQVQSLAVPKSNAMRICNYLPSLSCLLCYVYARLLFRLVSLSNLRHRINLAPLFGSVYYYCAKPACYVMFIWWCFVFYYIHGPVCYVIVWSVIQQLRWKTNKTIIYSMVWGDEDDIIMHTCDTETPIAVRAIDHTRSTIETRWWWTW